MSVADCPHERRLPARTHDRDRDSRRIETKFRRARRARADTLIFVLMRRFVLCATTRDSLDNAGASTTTTGALTTKTTTSTRRDVQPRQRACVLCTRVCVYVCVCTRACVQVYVRVYNTSSVPLICPFLAESRRARALTMLTRASFHQSVHTA